MGCGACRHGEVSSIFAHSPSVSPSGHGRSHVVCSWSSVFLANGLVVLDEMSGWCSGVSYRVPFNFACPLFCVCMHVCICMYMCAHIMYMCNQKMNMCAFVCLYVMWIVEMWVCDDVYDCEKWTLF